MRGGVALLLSPVPAIAAPSAPATRVVVIDLPAGTLGAAAEVLSRREAVNIVVADPVLWGRPVPAVRGRTSVEAAIRLLARHAGATARRVGTSGWRLTLRHPAQPARPRAALPIPTSPPPAADVVVQASKRAVPAADYAGSVDVIDGSALTGIDAGTDALVRRSAVLSSTYRGPGRDKLFVRGIADSSVSGQLQSVTGLYLGDVRLTYSASDPDLQLYDIASVEVLQGPQGTLYGSGSLGGIVRLNPNLPRRGVASGWIDAGASATVDGAPGGDVSAMANVPLGGDVAVRGVGYYRREGGFVQRAGVGDDRNRVTIAGGRATLRWWIAPGWTADATGVIQRIDARDSQYVIPPDPLDPRLVKEPFDSDYNAAHLVVNGRVGGATLVSATGLSFQQLHENAAIEGPDLSVAVARDQRLFSHETRFSGGDGSAGWVVGAAVAEQDGSYRARLAISTLQLGKLIDYRIAELALFGEATLRLSPLLSVGAGVRAAQVASTRRLALTFTPDEEKLRRTERWLLPTASVLVTPTSTLSLFARYQTAQRPTALSSTDTGSPTSDRVRGIEAGVRWSLPSGASAGLSLAHLRWRATQVDLLDLFDTGSYSIGESTIRTASASAKWPIAAGWSLDADLTLNRSRVKVAQEIADDLVLRLPSPATVARLGWRWSRPRTHGLSIDLQGYVRYEGPSDALVGLRSAGRQGDYLLTGTTVALDRGAGTLTLAIDNATNSRAIRFRRSSPAFSDDVTPLRPLTVRVGLRRRF